MTNETQTKKVAVVILNWNGKKLLSQFLPSVVEHSENAAIYVVDNASTDDSVFLLQTQFPKVKIIQNKNNLGYAAGYNEALKTVNEPYWVLLNSDVEVTQDWLLPIVHLFENQAEAAIIQPKILDFHNKNQFEYAGAAGGFIDQFGYPFCRGRIFDHVEKDAGQYNDTRQIFWASGACFCIRKEVFQKLNGFDAHFFAYQEEIDLCWRAFNQNYKVMYCGASTVFHVGGGTFQQDNPQKTFFNFRNNLLMLVKNLPKASLFKIILFRLVLDGLAGIRFLMKGQLPHFYAILRAHFSFYQLLKITYSKRSQNINKNYYHQKSIVSQYFLKNINVFKD
jgi:GT2 family glycosyltransferase